MTALDTATEVVSQSFNPDILLIFSDNATSVSHETHSTSAFPQFKRLPAELRCLIWEYAIPDAALIPRSWNNKRFQYNLQRRVPGVLQACAEARELLAARPDEPETRSSRYSLVQTHGEKTGTGAYVNWKADSIWIHRGYDISNAEVAAYANLRSLVMTWGLRPCWVDSTVDDGVKFLQLFPKLQLLTLLVDFSDNGWPEPLTVKGTKRLKRDEVKRIWALVRDAFSKAKTLNPDWQVPNLHIVHRGESWSQKRSASPFV